jgi:putative hydrolase of the HAD superfamily
VTAIEAVVFDFGGVFIGSPFEALRRFGDSLGIDAEVALALTFGSYDRDTDHPWHRAERGELALDACRTEILALASSEGVDLDLYEALRHMATEGGVRLEVVERTRRLRAEGVRTALLTNNVAEFAQFWRPMVPLDELFDAVVDSSEVGMRKPDPRIYRHTLELVGVDDPTRAVFLDDFEGNVVAAQAIGMHGIVVGPDPTPALAELDRILAAA